MSHVEVSGDPEGGWIFRSMRHDDLEFVVREHRRSFPTNVMTRLGLPLLRRYYRTFMDGPEVWAQIAEYDGEPQGFLVGVLDTRHRRRLLVRHHAVPLCGALTYAAVRNPVLMARMIGRRTRRAIARGRGAASNAVPIRPSGPVAVLSHVAVLPGHRGHGIGRTLVDAFVEAARARAVQRVALATLSGERGAGAFYEHLGWQRLGEGRTVDGRSIQLYDLNTSSVTAGGRVA